MQAFYHKNVVAYQQTPAMSNRSSTAPALDLEWEHQFDVGTAATLQDSGTSGYTSQVRACQRSFLVTVKNLAGASA
jgi:hypothetical protein